MPLKSKNNNYNESIINKLHHQLNDIDYCKDKNEYNIYKYELIE